MKINPVKDISSRQLVHPKQETRDGWWFTINNGSSSLNGWFVWLGLFGYLLLYWMTTTGIVVGCSSCLVAMTEFIKNGHNHRNAHLYLSKNKETGALCRTFQQLNNHNARLTTIDIFCWAFDLIGAVHLFFSCALREYCITNFCLICSLKRRTSEWERIKPISYL